MNTTTTTIAALITPCHMPTLTATITDCNGRPKPRATVAVEFHDGRPWSIHYSGTDYLHYRDGHNIASGAPMVQLRGEGDCRIWANLTATEITED